MRESYTWRQVICVAVGNPVLHSWNIAQTLLCNLGDVILVCSRCSLLAVDIGAGLVFGR